MDDLPLSRAAVEQQSLVAGVPSLPPTQHARPSTAGAASPPRAGMAAAPAELPAESPLASLATAALPSFSPDKPPQTQVLAAAAAADDALTPLPAVAAAGSAPRAARAAQRSSAGSPPAGGLQRSSTAATRWATSLRPPGEQLLPGLPDWDRSRPSSPNTGGGSSRSRSPTRYDGSTPGSPGSRRSSRAASPAGQSPLPGEARHCRQQQHAAPQPQPRQRPPSPQRGVSPPSQRPQQQEAEAAASSGPGPGPLTSMVVKAVSKLQQLQELEEELALPGGAGAGQRLPPGAAPRRRGPWQPSLRRSLEPALGAIQEAASDDDGRGSGSGGSGSRRRARSPMCSAELGRLQHLQEQLQGNMLEIQQRLDEQQGPSPAAAAASSSSSAGAGTLGSSEGMPAAWDAQDELPGAGFEHGYAPCRHHWGQHNDVLPASTAWQAAAAATSSLSDVEELSSAESLPQQQHSAGSAGVVMAVSNPLFGSSRPGNAESVPGAPGAPGALPPKRCLVVGQRRSPSESEAGGGGGASWPRQRQRRRSPEPSAGPLPSLGSLGSGFSALRQDFEAEVQQFLRGSLSAAPESHQRMQQVPSPLQQQQQAAAPLAAPAQKAPGRYPAVHSRRASGQATEEGSLVQAGISPAGSSCGAEAASPQPEAGGARVTRLLGSLDLAAILESRPASPAKLAPVGFSSEDGEDGEGGPWQTARSGGRDDADSGPDGWQTARSVAAEGWATAREHKRQLGIGERGDRALRSSNSEEWQSELARATEPAARQCLLASPDAQQQQPVQALRQQQRRQQGRGSGPTGDSDPAVADLQLLRITPRSTSPGRAAGSRGGSSHGSLAEVVQQTFPAQAVERLQALKAQLSPESQRRKHQQQRRQQGNEFASAHSYAGDSSQQGKGCASVSYADDSSQQASPGQQQQRQQQQQRVPHRTGGASVASSSTSGSLGGPPRERQLQPASRDSSAGTQQEGSSATGAPLAPRQASPELPGLGISRRQARLLQSAVGRMAGNPGEGADAADIQEALQDALVAQTAHVQAHYRQAAEARLAELRRHQAGDAPAQAAAALQREAAALQAAQEAATRRELESFVAEVLPRLADILSSRPKLLRCFEAAAEGADEGGADGSGVEDGSV